MNFGIIIYFTSTTITHCREIATYIGYNINGAHYVVPLCNHVFKNNHLVKKCIFKT